MRLRFAALVTFVLLGGAAARAEDAPPAPPAPPAGPVAYGETPDALVPHKGAGEPASRFFLEAPTYRGPGADDPEPAGLTEVRFGALVPLSGIDEPVGRRIVDGYTLALEEANAAGGCGPASRSGCCRSTRTTRGAPRATRWWTWRRTAAAWRSSGPSTTRTPTS